MENPSGSLETGRFRGFWAILGISANASFGCFRIRQEVICKQECRKRRGFIQW